MIRYLILFVGIILQNLSSVNAQKKVFTLKETQIDTVNKEFKSILILGSGSTATRIFLDNLSEVLIKKLKSEKIKSVYYYLNKASDTLSETFIAISKNDYDAILIFNPEDTAIFKSISKVNKNHISLPTIIGNYTAISPTTSITTSYHQSFNLNLYSHDDKSKALWEANLVVDFSMSGLSNYQNISNKIYWRLKAHKYLK